MTTSTFRIGDSLFFSVPDVPSDDTQAPTQGHLAILVDSSGSMGQWWASVATMVNSFIEGFGLANVTLVTFDGAAHVPTRPVLSTNQSVHGGGSTDIAAGFQQMSHSLTSIRRDTPTVLLFISDGCDNNGNGTSNCERIVKSTGFMTWPTNLSVVCCAVGCGFPTALSMGIREVLHKGNRAAAPLVVASTLGDLVRVADELRVLLCPRAAMTISPPAFSLPWDVEPSATATTGAYMFWRGTLDHVPTVNGIDCPRLIERSLISDVHSSVLMGLVRGWTTALQLESLRLRVSEVQAHATVALDMLRCLRQELNPAPVATESVRTTMLTRVQSKQVRTDQYAWSAFESELRKLAEGDVLSKLSDVDRAQRLRIGTMDGGKYQENALKKGAVTDEQFVRMRHGFIGLFEVHPLTPEMPCSQAPSLMTLNNTVEALCEEGLAAAIRLCDSQYAVVEDFPLVGMALELAPPSDGALINPFLALVRNVPRVAQVYDSQSLVMHAAKRGDTAPVARDAFSSCTIEIPIGDGDVEKVNAVLPLFNLPMDEHLRPWVSSELYKLMVHFQFMHTVDTYDPFTYLAALCALYVHLAQNPQSTWRDDRLRSVCHTANMAYGDQCRGLVTYVGALGSTDPARYRAALVTDHPENRVDGTCLRCEHLTKPLLLMSPMYGSQVVPSRDLGMYLILEFFGRAFGLHAKHSGETVSAFFTEPADLNEQITRIVDEIAATVLPLDFETLHMVREHAISLAKKAELPGEWLPNFTKIRTLGLHGLHLGDIFNVLAVNEWPSALIGELQSDQSILAAFYLASLEGNSYDRSRSAQIHTSLQDPGSAELMAQIQATVCSNALAAFRGCYASTLVNPLVAAYRLRIHKMHRPTLPLTRHEIEHECIVLGINHFEVKRSRSGLSSNTCFCRQCPFFMRPSKHFATHLNDLYADEPVIAYHVGILAERRNQVNVPKIYTDFLDGVHMIAVPGIKAPKDLTPDREMAPSVAEEILEVHAQYAQWTPADFDELAIDSADNNVRSR